MLVGWWFIMLVPGRKQLSCDRLSHPLLYCVRIGLFNGVEIKVLYYAGLALATFENFTLLCSL
jgi:hypothetical protein